MLYFERYELEGVDIMGRAHEVRAASMAATNAKKSALYMRASKEIYMAAKSGEPDPNSNLALRAVIEKYKGQKGRTRKDDTQRQKDNQEKRKLNKKLSEKKAKRKKLTYKLKQDDSFVKKISLIFKSKTDDLVTEYIYQHLLANPVVAAEYKRHFSDTLNIKSRAVFWYRNILPNTA